MAQGRKVPVWTTSWPGLQGPLQDPGVQRPLEPQGPGEARAPDLRCPVCQVNGPHLPVVLHSKGPMAVGRGDSRLALGAEPWGRWKSVGFRDLAFLGLWGWGVVLHS